MNPAADIIAQLIIDLGLGTDVVAEGAWPVSVGFLADSPDNAICVYDTAGEKDGRILQTGESIKHPGVQILVRGPGYTTTHEKAMAISATVEREIRPVVVIDSGTYLVENFSTRGDIQSLGMDPNGDKRRFNFTINAVTTIRKE